MRAAARDGAEVELRVVARRLTGGTDFRTPGGSARVVADGRSAGEVFWPLLMGGVVLRSGDGPEWHVTLDELWGAFARSLACGPEEDGDG